MRPSLQVKKDAGFVYSERIENPYKRKIQFTLKRMYQKKISIKKHTIILLIIFLIYLNISLAFSEIDDEIIFPTGIRELEYSEIYEYNNHDYNFGYRISENLKYEIINVDAKDPRLRILRPREGEVIFTDAPVANVVMRAFSSDDYSGVDHVRFSHPVHPGADVIDDTLPYEANFLLAVGDYRVDVRADDKAGNFEWESVNFSVRPAP